MPYISISVSSTIESSISIAFGTQTSISASTVTVLSKRQARIQYSETKFNYNMVYIMLKYYLTSESPEKIAEMCYFD